MPFEIIRNDIVKMYVDAIVNTANPEPIIGGGVDSAIHKSAGPELLKTRKTIGNIAVGDAVITPGFNLPSKYVIHTAGPVWQGGTHEEEKLLSSCYRKSLNLALENHCESVAFPLISTGTYGFPKPLALQIAVKEFSTFLMEHDMQIYLVIFGNEEFGLSEKLFKSVKSFIDENYIREKTYEEYGFFDINRTQAERRPIFQFAQQNRSSCTRTSLVPNIDACLSKSESLMDDVKNAIKKQQRAGFSKTLLELIDRTGKKDSDIYRKANIDRKLFSKIRNNPKYRPSKETVMAFGLALELELSEAEELLSRAGLAFSNSSQFDLVVKYFFIHRNYNIFELNEVLFEFGLPLLGGE